MINIQRVDKAYIVLGRADSRGRILFYLKLAADHREKAVDVREIVNGVRDWWECHCKVGRLQGQVTT